MMASPMRLIGTSKNEYKFVSQPLAVTDNHQTSRAGVFRRTFRPTVEAAPLLDRIEFALWKYLSALAAI